LDTLTSTWCADLGSIFCLKCWPRQGTIEHIKLFEFLGRIVGKAIYDGILVELRMASFFLRKMLGKVVSRSA